MLFVDSAGLDDFGLCPKKSKQINGYCPTRAKNGGKKNEYKDQPKYPEL